MDSKSISRKGVGVQVPASAPAPGVPIARTLADPLARALLPVLLHRVGNATQLLAGLDALIAVDPRALSARADDFAEAARRIDEAGWLLALLASASGANLLLERREARGLAVVVACVADVLRREGRDLGKPGRELPSLSPAVAGGWQLPWAIGSMLHACGRALPPRASLDWDLRVSDDGAVLACRGAMGSDQASADRNEFRAWLARELPAARWRTSGDGELLELPRGWLRAAEDSP